MLDQLSVGQLVLIGAILAPVFTAGAAWAAVKGSINGMRRQAEGTNKVLDEISAKLEKRAESDAEQNERLGSIEAKQEAHEGWIGRLEKWLERLQDLIERRSEER